MGKLLKVWKAAPVVFKWLPTIIVIVQAIHNCYKEIDSHISETKKTA